MASRNNMQVYAEFSVEEGIQLILSKQDRYNGVHFDIRRRARTRLEMFSRGQTTCAHCGLKGTMFRIERHANDHVFPACLNLYGHDEQGKMLMLTHDHIVPKTYGGGNKIENAQVLCEKCNSKKHCYINWDIFKLAAEHPEMLNPSGNKHYNKVAIQWKGKSIFELVKHMVEANKVDLPKKLKDNEYPKIKGIRVRERHPNTPIEQLVARYEAEECDHNNVGWLIKASRRYVETMDDCQVRCLLHAMANHLERFYQEQQQHNEEI